jgi:hypothetical protein
VHCLLDISVTSVGVMIGALEHLCLAGGIEEMTESNWHILMKLLYTTWLLQLSHDNTGYRLMQTSNPLDLTSLLTASTMSPDHEDGSTRKMVVAFLLPVGAHYSLPICICRYTIFQYCSPGSWSTPTSQKIN